MSLGPKVGRPSKYSVTEILKFIWRWKLVSTQMLSYRFYHNCSAKTLYNHINRLKRKKLIQRAFLENEDSHVWRLTDKGYRLIHPDLGELKEKGYRSEHPYHDYWVTAVHLGDWVYKKPKGVVFYTEQMLRRIDSELHPHWAIKSDDHRPDGYWLIPTGKGNAVVSLEVEIHPKTKSRYKEISYLYGREKYINRVIWVVSTAMQAKNIQTVFESTSAVRTNIHSYVLLSDIKQKSWGAPIIYGQNKGLKFREFLKDPIWEKAGKALGVVPKINYADFRFMLDKSSVCKTTSQ